MCPNFDKIDFLLFESVKCYSNVNQDLTDIQPVTALSEGPSHLMELAPDHKVNPDLRSFYFQAASNDEVLEWTMALLHDRFHSAKDERDAYKLICDSFPMQLSNLNDIINEKEFDQKEVEVRNLLHLMYNTFQFVYLRFVKSLRCIRFVQQLKSQSVSYMTKL